MFSFTVVIQPAYGWLAVKPITKIIKKGKEPKSVYSMDHRKYEN